MVDEISEQSDSEAVTDEETYEIDKSLFDDLDKKGRKVSVSFTTSQEIYNWILKIKEEYNLKTVSAVVHTLLSDCHKKW